MRVYRVKETLHSYIQVLSLETPWFFSLFFYKIFSYTQEPR